MPAPTLRTSLQELISRHPYDAGQRTCQCVIDRATDDDTITPITRDEHAAHVTQLILHTLNGANTILGHRIPAAS